MPDLKPRQVHPAKPVELPGGGTAMIDRAMIPLIRALWDLNFRTLGCCQDLGHAIAANGHGSTVPEEARRRHADFHRGQAWLHLPVEGACGLVALLNGYPVFAHRLRRWTHPDAWTVNVGISPSPNGEAEISNGAQIFFPSSQIAELRAVLTAHHRLKAIEGD